MKNLIIRLLICCLCVSNVVASSILPFPNPVSAVAGSCVIGGNDSFTKVLLHMDGSNGGTSFPDTNAGGSAHTWTASGATTDTSTFQFATASENAVGGSKYITTPDSTDFTLGSGDWTIDFWINVNGGAGTSRFVSSQLGSTGTNASGSFAIKVDSSNVMIASVFTAAVSTDVTGTTNMTTGTWRHVAFVRTGNILKLFINGTQEGGNVAYSGTVNDVTANLSVGRAGDFTSLTFNGYIDEFRLSVGVARWTANFTPPTGPYCP
jgi:concanavalin A-like lectin/glucanase superfamily protein